MAASKLAAGTALVFPRGAAVVSLAVASLPLALPPVAIHLTTAQNSQRLRANEVLRLACTTAPLAPRSVTTLVGTSRAVPRLLA